MKYFNSLLSKLFTGDVSGFNCDVCHRKLLKVGVPKILH